MDLDMNILRQIVGKLKNELIPLGSILIYSSEKIPHGYLPCDGRELSKKAYPDLYNLIGGRWGETNDFFFLPDLQGQFIRGWDKDGDEDPQRAFGSFQKDAFQGHGHETEHIKGSTSYSGSHTHTAYREEHGGGMGTIFYSLNHEDNCVSDSCKKGTANIQSSGSHCHNFELDINISSPSNSTYGLVRCATETRPKNVALMFCIKVK